MELNENYIILFFALFFYFKIHDINNKINIQNEAIRKIYNKIAYGIN
jgi:hypothetical protein